MSVTLPVATTARMTRPKVEEMKVIWKELGGDPAPTEAFSIGEILPSEQLSLLALELERHRSLSPTHL